MEYWLPLLLIALVCLWLALRNTASAQPYPDAARRKPPNPPPRPAAPGAPSPPVKVEILPPGMRGAPTLPLDPFDERRVHQDLQKLSQKPGLLQQSWDLHKQTKLREKEIQLVNQYSEFYSSATQMIEAKNKLLRARNEYLGMERENEEKHAEKEANIAKHRADAVRYEADAAEQKKRIEDLQHPAALEPKLTPSQQRLLKKAELQQELQRLTTDEADAVGKTTSEPEKKRIHNMYASRRDQLMQQLERFL